MDQETNQGRRNFLKRMVGIAGLSLIGQASGLYGQEEPIVPQTYKDRIQERYNIELSDDFTEKEQALIEKGLEKISKYAPDFPLKPWIKLRLERTKEGIDEKIHKNNEQDSRFASYFTRVRDMHTKVYRRLEDVLQGNWYEGFPKQSEDDRNRMYDEVIEHAGEINDLITFGVTKTGAGEDEDVILLSGLSERNTEAGFLGTFYHEMIHVLTLDESVKKEYYEMEMLFTTIGNRFPEKAFVSEYANTVKFYRKKSHEKLMDLSKKLSGLDDVLSNQFRFLFDQHEKGLPKKEEKVVIEYLLTCKDIMEANLQLHDKISEDMQKNINRMIKQRRRRSEMIAETGEVMLAGNPKNEVVGVECQILEDFLKRMYSDDKPSEVDWMDIIWELQR